MSVSLELSSPDSSSAGFVIVHLSLITSSDAVNMSLESTHVAIQRRGFVRSTKASSIVESINDWVTGVSSRI